MHFIIFLKREKKEVQFSIPLHFVRRGGGKNFSLTEKETQKGEGGRRQNRYGQKGTPFFA